MKSLATRRTAPTRSSKDERKQKINRLPREIDVRRWKALKTFVAREERLGRPFNPARIARRKGHQNGTMASHILNGHASMNEIWMLFIAADYAVAPQVIWGKDWPLSELTPDLCDRGLRRVCQQWETLSASTRKKIITLAMAMPTPPLTGTVLC